MADIKKNVTIWINGQQVTKTIAGIQKEMQKVKNELRNCTIGTEEYEKKAKRLRQLKGVLDEHQRDLKGVERDWRDIVHTLGDVGNIMSGIRSFGYILSGFANSIVQTTQEMTRLDDLYGKVRKTTGMTAEEVDRLNDAFKKMDTRTSREQLNELAYQAGKLGITGVKNVEQFVKASDQINVALGDVLGDDAMITIGKLSGVYEKVTSQLDGLDLEHKMLRIGDAVNQLGESSTANEQYIVDFTARLAGVATQAGLSADQIMGFASALDQDMQRVEMSATAFQKLIVQVFRKPEQFARMAGKSVKEFSDLVKTDMNGALMLLLQNMKSNDGLEALIPFLDDVKLAGQRATTVIADMANNLSKVKEAQYIANEQLREGGSMLFEYQKMNETAQAKMEKLKKEIVNVKEALGKELYPIAIELVNLGGVGLKGLTGLVQLVKQFWPVLAVTAGYYATLGALQLKRIAQTQIENALKKVRLVFDQKEIQQQKIAEAQRATEMRQRYELIAAEQSDIVTKNTEEAVRLKLKASMYAEEIATNKLTIAKLREQAATAKGARHSQLMREIRMLETRSITAQAMSEQYLTRAKELEGAATVASTRASKYAKAAKTAETVATNAHTAAVEAEKVAMASTPWGLIIIAITAAANAVYNLVSARKKHIEAIKAERDALNFADKNELEEKARKIAEEKNDLAKQRAAIRERQKANGGSMAYTSAMGPGGVSQEREDARIMKDIDARMKELDETSKVVHANLQKIKKQEQELAKIGGDIGAGSGGNYTPSNDLKSNPFASVVDALQSYILDANARVKSGLEETIDLVTNKYKKLKEDIKNASPAEFAKWVSGMTDEEKEMFGTSPTQQGLIDKLGEAYDKMKQAKIDDYIDKVNKEAEKLAAKMKPEDANKYLEKVMQARLEMNENIKNANEMITQLESGITKLEGMIQDKGATEEQKKKLEAAKKMWEQYLAYLKQNGLKSAVNDIGVDMPDAVVPYRKQGGIKEIRSAYKTRRLNAESDTEAKIKDLEKKKKAFENAGDTEKVKEVTAAIQQLNDNLKVTKANLEKMEAKEVFDKWIDGIRTFSDAILDIFSSLNTLLNNLGERQLKEDENRRNRDLENLEERYKNGVITQEKYEQQKESINNTYNQKKNALELEQWRREKALNISQASMDGILAVMKTFAEFGWPAGAAMAALQTAASAVQIGALIAEPAPYARGGYANEKTYMVGESGPEWVASNRLLQDKSTAPIIAALEDYQRGNGNALRSLGMSQPAWGDVSMAGAEMGVRRSGGNVSSTEALNEILHLLKHGGVSAVISRREMERFEKNENFLRNAARF